MNITKQITTVTTMAMFGAVYALHGEVVNITQGSTTGYELTDGNTYVIRNSVSFSNSTAGGSGMSVADGATVVIYIPKDVTLTAIGANGSGQIGGGAGIRVPEAATLVITGEGSVKATGGNAGNGGNGMNGCKGTDVTKSFNQYWRFSGSSGFGGGGGSGGGGAGAAIGGPGGYGGYGGGSGECVAKEIFGNYNNAFCQNGNDGNPGLMGNNGVSMGNCYVLGEINAMATVGCTGIAGAVGEFADMSGLTTQTIVGEPDQFVTCGGGGGGGGGAGCSPSKAIGGGGSAGGGGGGGGSGATLGGASYVDYPFSNAHGGAGLGGMSDVPGKRGIEKGMSKGGGIYKQELWYGGSYHSYYVGSQDYYGGEGGMGGAAGAEGDAGFLYVSPTAVVDVEREKLVATTHSAAQYEMTFDANGGQFVMSVDSLTATLGCELPDCIPAPTRNGFAFDGWESATGEEYYGAAGTKTISSYPVAGDVVLYAQWKAVGHTSTTPVPVPYSYFDENCPTLLSAHGGDYEAVAHSSAMNGCNKVWECYVSGISPTNKDSRFTAIIKIGLDGKPILSWKPPLNGETAEGAGIRGGVRSYSVYGKQTLDDAAEEWTSVAEGDEGIYHFFKVTVGMP